jgi:hypothetical protein
MWFLSGYSWSTRLLNFNYNRGYYPPDIPYPTPAPVYNPASISSFSANKSSIEVGDTVILTWTTANATSVTISPGFGTVATSGSTTVTPAASTTYTLAANGKSGNSVSSTATITVRPRVSPAINISQPTIKRGQTTSLSWNAPGAIRVSITGVGAAGISGTMQVSPVETATYTLTATYIDGTSQSASVTVTVEQPPYLLWGLIALLVITVIVIAALLIRRPARARRAQAAETQAGHAAPTEDTDTADTELATTPVVEAAAAKLSLPGGNDILLAGNTRSLGRHDFEDFMQRLSVGEFKFMSHPFRKLRGALHGKAMNGRYQLMKSMGLNDDKREWEREDFTLDVQDSNPLIFDEESYDRAKPIIPTGKFEMPKPKYSIRFIRK